MCAFDFVRTSPETPLGERLVAIADVLDQWLVLHAPDAVAVEQVFSQRNVRAVIEVGGVGIAVVCAPATLAALDVGAPARLSTSLVVREDALTLYGFGTDDERSVFETLQSVTGVGPRLAQAVLAVHSPDAVRAAVATEDIAAFVLVPGI